MATTPKAAKPTANRAARRADAAKAKADKASATPPADKPVDDIPPPPPTNFNVDAIKADMIATLDRIADNETGTVKLTQRVAWDLMRVQESFTDPVTYQAMKADADAYAKWVKVMSVFMLGKAPSMAGTVDQTRIDAAEKYKARMRIFKIAAPFVVALGLSGVTSDHFSETLDMFAVPGKCFVPIGFSPAYDFADAVNAGAMIPVDNHTLTMSTRTKAGKTATQNFRAAVAQVVRVFHEKPASSLDVVAEALASDATSDASGNAQQNPASSIDPKVRDIVLKHSTIPQLATALLAAFNDDPAIDIAKSQFSNDEWETLMLLAQRLGIMAHKAQAQADKPKPAKRAA
jgi:hypothetical protein